MRLPHSEIVQRIAGQGMSHDQATAQKLTPAEALAADLVNRIESVLVEAERDAQPLEIDPQRSRLFELFVLAEAGGYLEEGAEHDLTCDGLARLLARRWKLARGLEKNLANASGIPAEQLSRLRRLWSFMRLWNEWTYAWGRWAEFHEHAHTGRKRPARH